MGKRKPKVKRSLRPAITDGTTFWVAPEGGAHIDIAAAFEDLADFSYLYGDPASNGFVSDENIFYDRPSAWEYAWEHGLLSRYTQRWASQNNIDRTTGWLNSYDLAAQDEPKALAARELAWKAHMEKIRQENLAKAEALASQYLGETS